MAESKTAELIMGDDEEEVFVQDYDGSAEDDKFDNIVGCLEELLLDGQLPNMQREFCYKHCGQFEPGENKLVYTDIFNEYVQLVEQLIESKLKAKMPDFTLEEFEAMAVDRKDEMAEELVDLLQSLGDFNEFKDMMIQYRKGRSEEKSGNENMASLSITGSHVDYVDTRMHTSP